MSSTPPIETLVMLPLPPNDVLSRARSIELVVFDVDGVLTDGRLDYGRDGQMLARFHAHDGLGIQLLFDAGIEVAVVSGRSSEALERRMEELHVTHFYPHTRDKLAAVQALASELGVALDRVCFMGDDVLDLPAMQAVGLAVSVHDGHPVVQKAAHWVVERGGGHGAVRMLADTILEAQHGLERAYERYLSSVQRRQRQKLDGEVDFGVIIPARYASTRLPGKPLLELCGKPMILHALETAERAGASFVAVATDDERIVEVVEAAGGEAWMTSASHSTGTDRVAEVVNERGLPRDAIIVNLQGDEPLMDPQLIREVATSLGRNPSVGAATAATPIRDVEQLLDPNVVKVVVDQTGRAVSFSRAPIPWVRDLFKPHAPPEALPDEPTFLRHLGIYGYRVAALRRVTAHPPVTLEQAEALEQLRMLWLGIPIQLTVVDEEPAHGVDTEEDRAAMEELLRQREGSADDRRRAAE